MKENYSGLKLQKLSQNITGTFFRQMFGILVGLGLSILIARTLGPTGNGQYAMAILLPTMLISFLNLGVAPANVYFIASGKITPYSAIKSNILIWLFLSIIGMVASIFVILKYSSEWFPSIPKNLLWLSIVAFPLGLLQAFLGSILQGLQDFKKYNYVLLVAPVTTLLLAIILLGVIELGVIGALIAFIGGQLVGLLIALIAIKPIIQQTNKKNSYSSNNYSVQCLTYGWKAHMSNILTFINYRADIFLVNFFLNPAQTGIYVIAVQIAEKLWVLSQVVSTVILPRLSELHTEEDKRRILTPMVARWVFFVSLAGAVIIALVASPLITLLYGTDYTSSYDILLLLLPGILIGSLYRVLANDIAARGKPEMNFYISTLTVIINVTLNIILIQLMGIKGAAIATTIAYTITGIGIIWIYTHLSKNQWQKTIMFSYSDWELFYEGISTIKKMLEFNKKEKNRKK